MEREMIIVEYAVAVASSMIGLHGRVADYILAGYQPFGSLTVNTIYTRQPNGLHETTYFQPMVKYE
jgi:hypothetical protein